MKYLKVFTDFVQDMDKLGDAERGRLFTAMLLYAETGEEPALRGNEQFVWGTAKKIIDNQRKSYDHRCEVNKANGSEPKRKEAKGSDSLQEKEKEKEIKETSPNGDAKKMRDLYLDAWFKDFWTLYPRKVDKQDAAKAWKKLNPDEALFQSIIEGLRKWCKYWDLRKEPEFIPHPSRWINARRWESEPPEQAFRSVMNDEPKRKKNPALRYEQKPISKEDFDALTVDLTGGVT